MSGSRKRLIVVAAFAVAAFAIAGSVVYAGGGGGGGVVAAGGATPLVTGTCAVGKQSFATHGDGNSTTSTTFVDIPGAVVSFTASAKAKCVSVLFTSMAAAQGNEILMVRALLDNAVVGLPEETQFTGTDDFNAARSYAMNFVFPSVAAGAHIVKMQFRSFSGGNVFVHRGTTIVNFK
jgi:hypothetical protein